MYLAVSLREQAQGVLGNLPDILQMYFKELSRSLEERFSPMNQTELYRAQLKKRRQKATGTLPRLGQDIHVRRLTRLAYPTASADVCENLAREYYIDSLLSFDMRLRIKQDRPQHLNDAIRHAGESNAYIGAGRTKHHDAYSREVGCEQQASESDSGNLEEVVRSMKDMLLNLQKDVDQIKQGPRKFQNRETTEYVLRKFNSNKVTLRFATIVASQGIYNETVDFQKQRKECTLMEKRISSQSDELRNRITRERGYIKANSCGKLNS